MARIGRYLGGPLFPMQRYVAEVMSEIDPRTGEWAYDKAVLIAPRRAGKTYLERSIITERCSTGRTSAMMTAQTREAAAARWAEIVYSTPGSLESNAELGGILHITKGNSSELCRWPNGSEFRPFAPQENAIHGAEPDLVWVTELWWHGLDVKRALQNAYRPAWSVKPGQEILESAGGTSRSLWLKSERLSGREATYDPLSRTAYFEWSVHSPDTSVDELLGLSDDDLLDLVIAHHPRRDHGLRREFLRGELLDEDTTRADFLRAYGGVDADDASTTLVIPARWRATSITEPIPHSDTGVRVGVGVAVDKRGSAICAAWVRPDGATVVEVVNTDAGQLWTADYVRGMPGVAAVAVAPKGFGQKVAEAVEGESLELVKFGTTERHAAGVDFVARLVEGKGGELWHVRDSRLDADLPHAVLTAASGIGSGDGELVVTVQAAAAAVWAAEHAPAPKPKRWTMV